MSPVAVEAPGDLGFQALDFGGVGGVHHLLGEHANFLAGELAMFVEFLRVAHDHGQFRGRQTVNLVDDLGGGHGRIIGNCVAAVNSHTVARMTARDQWMEKLRASFAGGTFVKFTLSRPRERKAELRNVYARFVDLKAGRAVSLTLRYATKDVTRNVTPAETPAQVGSLLSDVFEEANLFTTTGDFRLKADAKGEGTMKASRPTFSAVLPTAHDRPKERALANAPFLTKLGVTSADGVARPGMADKLRQVERFVEILGHLTESSPFAAAESVRVCDMGAGKGYLTFAAHEYFRRRGKAEVIGVEQREDLVGKTNAIARELECEGLRFDRGTIADFPLPAAPDVLIALHACDTATDDALAAGVRAGAKLIVVAPCCHKEVRSQMRAPEVLAAILRHGILAERQAEVLTDGLRALVLEAWGYEAKVFEFVSNEHTGKNLMIAATKRGDEDMAGLERARTVMREFGIERFRLLDELCTV